MLQFPLIFYLKQNLAIYYSHHVILHLPFTNQQRYYIVRYIVCCAFFIVFVDAHLPSLSLLLLCARVQTYTHRSGLGLLAADRSMLSMVIFSSRSSSSSSVFSVSKYKKKDKFLFLISFFFGGFLLRGGHFFLVGPLCIFFFLVCRYHSIYIGSFIL